MSRRRLSAQPRGHRVSLIHVGCCLHLVLLQVEGGPAEVLSGPLHIPARHGCLCSISAVPWPPSKAGDPRWLQADRSACPQGFVSCCDGACLLLSCLSFQRQGLWDMAAAVWEARSQPGQPHRAEASPTALDPLVPTSPVPARRRAAHPNSCLVTEEAATTHLSRRGCRTGVDWGLTLWAVRNSETHGSSQWNLGRM